MCKTDKLIEHLISAGIIDKFCDKVKAKDIIRQYLEELHNETVQSTIMASNKKHFTAPIYNDII